MSMSNPEETKKLYGVLIEFLMEYCREQKEQGVTVTNLTLIAALSSVVVELTLVMGAPLTNVLEAMKNLYNVSKKDHSPNGNLN